MSALTITVDGLDFTVESNGAHVRAVADDALVEGNLDRVIALLERLRSLHGAVPQVGLRRCVTCKADLPVDMFARHRGALDRSGRQSRCRTCANADSRARRAQRRVDPAPRGDVSPKISAERQRAKGRVVVRCKICSSVIFGDQVVMHLKAHGLHVDREGAQAHVDGGRAA